MKVSVKNSQCLNCGNTLQEADQYCAQCGQENRDSNIPVGAFVYEFFANYLSVDSKIGRSVVPFLFKPGCLTNQFNQGKRVSYVHPLRLYLIISVVFFFLATLLVKQSWEQTSFTIEHNPIIYDTDSVTSAQLTSKWSAFRQIMEDRSFTDQQAIDSLNSVAVSNGWELPDVNSFLGERNLFRQTRKVMQNGLNIFSTYLIQNLPVMMFVLLPFFALLLKWLYSRRKVLYVQHLVHALHLHSFAFLLFALLILCYLTFNISSSANDWLEFIVFLLLIAYIYASFLRVYQQSLWKTGLKILLLGSMYFLMMILFGLSEVLISFLIF